MNPPRPPQAAGPPKRLLDAVAAHRKGDLDTAERLYRAILKDAPDDFDATQLLGAIAHMRGRYAEAEALLRRAIARNGKAPAAHNNLGNVVMALGRREEAIACYDRAIALDGNYVDALVNRGNLLDDLERDKEALADYERALALAPDDARALQRSARLLAEAGRREDALVRNERAMALGQGSAEAWMRSGNILVLLGRPREALESYDKALALDPRSTLCAVNRSAALDQVGRSQEALDSLDRAQALDPKDPGILNNKATILKSLGRLDEALPVWREAIQAAPNDANTQTNYAMACLLTGDFETGLAIFEQRWAKKENAGKRPALPFPEWKGEPLKGKRIMVYAEQGLGDIVQFSRYLPMLQAADAQTAFLVGRKMHALLAASFPGIGLFDDVAKARLQRCDYSLGMMSLMLRFGTRPDTVPALVPYLKPDPARVARWRARIGGEGFRIGIAWQGNPNTAIDAGRSIPLAAFAPLAAVPGVRLISLQKNEGAEQRAGAPMAVEDLGPEFDAGRDAFLDTMAAMQSLDLAISSDTAIAHVAGALDRPVWVALRRVPDWRWMLGRDDSPWYPSMRLFRQQTAGDWDGVFASMRRALDGEVRRRVEPGALPL
ncbi:MAG TPA: tetratricopeptide repeat protein [Rhizomicrobium sp.]|nr:tetratricopeptide repeat protein [Rhizomicrobium sp.]